MSLMKPYFLNDILVIKSYGTQFFDSNEIWIELHAEKCASVHCI